jgi:hypothetical protein
LLRPQRARSTTYIIAWLVRYVHYDFCIVCWRFATHLSNANKESMLRAEMHHADKSRSRTESRGALLQARNRIVSRKRDVRAELG